MAVNMTTTVPLRPPQRRRVHEDVAAQLRDAILDGRFAPGEKLPPERELAERFQVNRTSVREAIKVLEGLGLVSVRQGDGATVQPMIEASLGVIPAMIFHAGAVDHEAMQDLFEVVTPLLFEMARLAIERHQPSQLVELRRVRSRMADPRMEPRLRFAAARDLLVLLSDMTGNRVWQMLARRTREMLASEPMCEARERLRRDPGRAVPLIDRCLDAIDAGHPEEAVAALRDVVHFFGEAELDSNRNSEAPERAAVIS
jgi:DNA-binding FadR family transcriptional regulator